MPPPGVDGFERPRRSPSWRQRSRQLNERYRTALVLKDLHGLPPAEIASVMHVSRPVLTCSCTAPAAPSRQPSPS